MTFQRQAMAEDWQARFQEEAQVWRAQQQSALTAEAQAWQQRQVADMQEILQQARAQGAVPAWQPPVAAELDPNFIYGHTVEAPADEEDDVSVELDFHLAESPSRR